MSTRATKTAFRKEERAENRWLKAEILPEVLERMNDPDAVYLSMSQMFKHLGICEGCCSEYEECECKLIVDSKTTEGHL